MDTQIVEKIKERIATNPYVNFLGIHFSKIEEGFVEARMPLHNDAFRKRCSNCRIENLFSSGSLGIRTNRKRLCNQAWATVTLL